MKKRRELDALVGGVKPRRKTSNFSSKSSTGSSHELLRYNGSDSSDEDYRLHPTKVRNTGLCSTCTSVLVFILLVACLLVCTGLTWMHVEMKKDLEILRKDLQAVELRSSKSSEDVDKLSPDIQNINKTLQHLISDLASVNTTVTQVTGTITKLGKSLDAAPELKELPGKLQSVSKVLADLGSDVQGMKDTIDSVPPFMKSTKDSIDDVYKQLDKKVDADTDGREHGSTTPDLENIIQVINQQIQDMNSSLSGQVSVLMKASTKQEARLSQLENTTNILLADLSTLKSSTVTSPGSDTTGSVDVNSEAFHQQVTDIVQQVLGDTGKVDAVMTNITKVLESLNTLKEKYEHLDTQSGPPTGETTGGNYVTLEMFNTMEDGVNNEITTLNTSFYTLKSDVKTMSQLLTRQSNTVTNLTHQIDAIQAYMGYIRNELSEASNKPTTVKQPSVTVPPNVKTPEPEVTVTEADQKGASTTPKVPTTTSKNGEETPGTISIDRIKNFDDLELNYNRWNMHGTGVRYSDLPGFLGPDTPAESVLKPFDENGDDIYTLEEFATAFGFKMPSTVTTASSTAAPPR